MMLRHKTLENNGSGKAALITGWPAQRALYLTKTTVFCKSTSLNGACATLQQPADGVIVHGDCYGLNTESIASTVRSTSICPPSGPTRLL